MGFQQATFLSAFGNASQIPSSALPEVVFSGKSNVGKSSLINKLINRKSLARVSATPGKTATINFYDLKEFLLVDLPGYGYAKVSQNEKLRWAELVEGYLAQNRKFALVIQIIDVRHAIGENDLHMVEYLYDKGLPFAVVLTKTDKLKKTQLNKQLEYFNDLFKDMKNIKIFPFSALKGIGTEEIRQEILSRVNQLYTEG